MFDTAFLVPRTRLELARPCDHQPLKLTCLPIPPSGREIAKIAKKPTFQK